MFKKILLTYYYVLFKRQLKSKYARESTPWFRAFAQVVVTLSLYLIILLGLIEVVCDIRIFKFFTRFHSFLLTTGCGGLLYFLLFNIYGASKTVDDHLEKGIEITKIKENLTPFFFFGSIALLIIGVLLRKKLLGV